MKFLTQKIYNLLRKSEQFLKTDMVYLTKGGFWVGVKRIVGSVAGLGLSIAFANLLSQETFGIYKFLLSIGALITAFSLTGMGAAVSRAVARGYEGTVRAGLRENLTWSVGMVALSLIGSFYYFINDNATLSSGLLITAAFLPLIYSFDLYSAYFKGKKDFRTDAFFALPRLIVPPVALIGTLFLTTNPIVLIFIYYASQAIIIVASYYLTTYLHQFNTKTDADALHFSKHLSVMGVLETVSSNIDKILLFHFLGAAPLAVYTFATAPIREIRKLNTLILTPAFPKLSQRSLSELKKSLPYRMGMLALILIPLIGAYIVAAPYLYAFLFPQYMESVLYSQIFAFSLLFMPFSIMGKTLIAHMKKRELYILNTSTPLIRIAALLILLPLYGIWGAIAAILVTHIINTFLVVWFFRRS